MKRLLTPEKKQLTHRLDGVVFSELRNELFTDDATSHKPLASTFQTHDCRTWWIPTLNTVQPSSEINGWMNDRLDEWENEWTREWMKGTNERQGFKLRHARLCKLTQSTSRGRLDNHRKHNMYLFLSLAGYCNLYCFLLANYNSWTAPWSQLKW